VPRREPRPGLKKETVDISHTPLIASCKLSKRGCSIKTVLPFGVTKIFEISFLFFQITYARQDDGVMFGSL
jgi:hypothetical protein